MVTQDRVNALEARVSRTEACVDELDGRVDKNTRVAWAIGIISGLAATIMTGVIIALIVGWIR